MKAVANPEISETFFKNFRQYNYDNPYSPEFEETVIPHKWYCINNTALKL